jgi:membrane protein
VTRALLPSLLTKLLNTILARIPGYKGHVDAVELNLTRGRFGVRGISLRQDSPLDHQQSLDTELVVLQLDWKSALSGRLVGEIEIDNPRLFLSLNGINHNGGHNGAKKPEIQTHGEVLTQPSWQEKVANLYPFKLTEIRLLHGEVNINDIAGEHDSHLRLERLNLLGENITNNLDLSPSLMSKISCRGRVMSQGTLALNGEGHLLAQSPTFNVDFKTENIDLRELRSVINHFLELQVRTGLMDLYVEAAAKQGQIHGYAKPVFDHLEIEPPAHSSFGARIKAWLAELIAKLGKNKKVDRIATRMSFDGPFKDPHLDIMGAATQFLRNAFSTALSASLEHRVRFTGAKRTEAEVEIVYRKPHEAKPGRMGRIFGLAKETVSLWIGDSAPRMAASLSYYTIFSLAPLLILIIAAGGLLLGRQAAQGAIMHQLEGLLGRAGAAAVQSMIEAASKPTKGVIAAIIGTVTLLFGATGVLAELKAGLNTIWRTQETGGITEVVKRNVVFLGMILGIAFLLIVSLAINAALAMAGKFMGGMLPVPEVLLQAINFVVAFGVITVLFAAIYKILPNTKIDWHDVWIGAAVTSLLFSIGKLLVGLYIGKLVAGSVYGAAGSILIVFVWVYYSGLIVYLGAEFTRVYAQNYGSRTGHVATTEETA